MKRGRALVIDGVPLKDDSPFSKVDTKSKKKSKRKTQVKVYKCVLYVGAACYLARVYYYFARRLA